MRTLADAPLEYNAVEVLERNLASRRDKVALFSPERSLTFGEVSAEVDLVARALVEKLGVRIGEHLAILSQDGAEWAATFFGIVKAGGVAVSINTMVPSGDLAYILRDCRARVIFVHNSLLPVLDEIRAEQRFLEHVVVVGSPGRAGDTAYVDLVRDVAPGFEGAPTHRDDLCMLNYSSGTTGEPKGIPHAHKDLPITGQLYAVEGIGLRESDTTFSVAKLFFTYGSCGNMIWPWCIGASVIFQPAPSRVATNLLEMIARFRPTVFNGVPTSYATMLALDGMTERYDLSSIRMCISAGESLPIPVWEAWKAATGHEICEGIGTTENLALYLVNRAGDVRPGSVGKPVPGYELRIVDDAGQSVAQGEAGVLHLKGETTALQYLHQYERSRQTFLGEWVSTGDRFLVDADGFYHYVGRADDMLKVGGIWVSPIEIEHTLTAHAAVLECAVIGHPDASGLIKPKAFVVLNAGYERSDTLARALVDHCGQVMASFKRPRWIEFVDELPRTATGKVQRSRLK